MMRKILFIIVGIMVVTTPVSYAESGVQLTTAQLAQLKTTCINAKTSLWRIHANDGPAYVNSSQWYEVIVSRFMAPMNSRIALNKLDGLELSATTVDYMRKLDEFRTQHYPQYEQSISALSKMDCSAQPNEFYTLLGKVRDYRQVVYDDMRSLNALIVQYRTQLGEFQKKIGSK